MTRNKPTSDARPVSLLLLGSRSIGAAAFKTHCLEIMDDVERSGAEVVITKHRRAVARLVPARAPGGAFCGALRGRIIEVGEIVEPVEGSWENDDANFA
ncbi:MAG: type II toxin-antitoxin system Phd/YefM family antitoxin [Candidatus Baltobacteraceae bacterium]